MKNTQEAWTPVRRFFKMLELDRRDITYIYVYAIFAGLITLSLPLGVQAIIGLIAGGATSSSLYLLIGIVTVGTALTGILKIMQLTVSETLQRRIFSRSSFEFAYRIPRLKLENLRSEYPPELVNRFFDTLTIQKGLPKILMDFSSAILQIVFGLILISFYHSFFVFFGIVLILVLAVIFYFTGPIGLKTSLQESKYKYKVAHWLEELARTNSTFKLSGDRDFAMKKTDGLVSGYLDSRKKHFRILLFQYGNIVAFKTIVTGALLLLGSILVIENQINIGQFVAAEIVVLLIIGSVEKLILSMETIYDVLTGLEKIGFVTDIGLDKEDGMKFEDVDTGDGMKVEIDNLNFKFQDDEDRTLKDINLTIAPGEKVCITGYNRSGKSTLVQTIAGLYTDYEGSLLYNKIPQRSFNLSDLRRHIGDATVQEDIFQGTVYENITLGQPDVTIQDVLHVAEKMDLMPFIQNSPEGLNTQLLPGGRNIPGSIREKIVLCRSVVFKPHLLTVDKIFPNIKKEEREQIIDYILDQRHKWSVVAVSDNAYFASQCDKVIVMKKGKIIMEGTYAEVKKTEHYPRIFNPGYKVA